jgi:hypothetical protein
MPARFNRWVPVVLLLLASGLIYLRFPDYFPPRPDAVIEPYGDGFKAYHAILYHARYDTSLFWYEGMNYPYGEHVVPGASQPAFSTVLLLLRRAGVDWFPAGFALVHYSMLLGLLGSVWLLYLLLRRFELPAGYASLIALGWAFLAPQLERIGAHYGLAHPEVIPLTLYLLKRWTEDRHWRWSLLLAAVVAFYALIHFYYLAVLAFCIGGFVVIHLLLSRDYRAEWRGHLSLLGLSFVLPAALLFGAIAATDPVSDRNEAPWGFFAFHSEPEGILTHPAQPHWAWFSDHLVRIENLGYEAWAYIGLPAAAFLGYLLWCSVRRSWRRQPWVTGGSAEESRYLRALLISSGLVLLFAFGLPFVVVGGELWLEKMGPLRQFRSVARFAWIFFYAINLATWVFLYRWAHGAGRRRYAVLGLAVVVLYFEAYQHTTYRDLRLDSIPELRAGHRYTDIDSLDFSRYQAIVPAPYFNIGSDNFWWDMSGFVGQKALTLSWETGLPLTAAMLTRTSLQQTLNQLQLVTEPYRPPRLLTDLPDQRPLLLLWDSIRIEEYGGRFDALREGATRIYTDPPLSMYELPLAAFAERIQSRKDSVLRQLALRGDSTGAPAETLRIVSAAHYQYTGFDTTPADRSYVGAGAFQGTMRARNRFGEFAFPPRDSAEQWVFSAWMYIGADRNARAPVELIWIDTASGEERHRASRPVRELVRVFDANGWALLEWPIELPAEATTLRAELQFPLLGDRPLFIDEVLLRPQATDLYGWYGDRPWRNNRWYE